MLASLGLTV